MKNVLMVFLVLAISACSKTDKYDVENFYTRPQSDSLLVDIITYMYTTDRVPKEERFQPKYRFYYVSQLPKFSLQKLFVTEDGTNYYYVVRPTNHIKGYKRGVGGKFKLDANHRIISFEESFVTPIYPEEDIKKKGDYLFEEYVKDGKVDSFVKMKSYVEWPDGQLRYDEGIHEWTY